MYTDLEIDEQKQIQLSILKGKMLMWDDFLYKIEDYNVKETKETPEKSFFNWHPKEKTTLVLISIKILAYNSDGKFIGYLTKESAERMVSIYNLYYFREVWVKFNEQLQAFGLKVRKTNDTTLLFEAFEAGREYQEYKSNVRLEVESWKHTYAKWCEKKGIPVKEGQDAINWGDKK